MFKFLVILFIIKLYARVNINLDYIRKIFVLLNNQVMEKNSRLLCSLPLNDLSLTRSIFYSLEKTPGTVLKHYHDDLQLEYLTL